MPEYRQLRLDRLLSSQNPDGGWGYFPGRQSWIEPTAYALLALANHGPAEANRRGGRTLISGWQNKDGGFRAAASVAVSSWATSLVVTFDCASNQTTEATRSAARWLLSTRGSEGSLFERALNMVHTLPVEYDRRFKGWPWSPGASSWIEPTAHALVALRRSLRSGLLSADLKSRCGERIQEAERMIADRRSVDGGWNYGNRRVLKKNLPSYPETTALALIGLAGSSGIPLDHGLRVAEKGWRETRSRLAKAWLAIALRAYGREVLAANDEPGDDVMLNAIEALAAPEGGAPWRKA